MVVTMPNYNFHRKVGFIFSLILIVVFTIFYYKKFPLKGWQWLVLPLIILFFSNLPDFDMVIGRLRKNTLRLIFFIMLLSGILSFFISFELMILILMFTGLLGLGMLKVKHRGPLHTYWFALLASLPLLFLHWFLFITALTCSFLHIFIDRVYSKLKRIAKKIFNINGVTHKHVFVFKW